MYVMYDVGRSNVIYQYRTLLLFLATYNRLLPTANVQYFMGYQLINLSTLSTKFSAFVIWEITMVA